MRQFSIICVGVLLFFSFEGISATQKKVISLDPRSWETNGVMVEEDARGFVAPVSIAFLHQASSSPTDVEYFVTELQGVIKAVLNNKQVITVATVPRRYVSDKVIPHPDAAYGLHGICVAPDDSFVITTAVEEVGGRRTNRILKWTGEGTPRWHQLKLEQELREPFLSGFIGGGHSIGQCVVGPDKTIWVGVGDGGVAKAAANLDSTNGKILRLNENLTPAGENPFKEEGQQSLVKRMVYASGFRNPWAISLVGEKLFVADNGNTGDRLVVAKPGKFHFWNGKQESLTFGNEMYWPHSIAPVSMVYFPKGNGVSPLNHSLILTATGTTQILSVPLDEDLNVSGPAKRILDARKRDYLHQSLSGIALRKGVLYFAHMKYTETQYEKSSVYRLKEGAPLAEREEPRDPLSAHGCFGCHSFESRGSQQAPVLTDVGARVGKRFGNLGYLDKLRKRFAALKGVSDSHRELFEDLLKQKGDERLMSWIELKLLRPDFDPDGGSMPNLDLPPSEARRLAQLLLKRLN